MFINTVKGAIFSLVALALLVMCNNNNQLSVIEGLIDDGQYEEAVTRLNAILIKDQDNKQAKLLHIRANMLRKKLQRNEDLRADTLNSHLQRDKAGQSRSSVDPISQPKGFSIMSLCQEKGTGNISKITDKLSTN